MRHIAYIHVEHASGKAKHLIGKRTTILILKNLNGRPIRTLSTIDRPNVILPYNMYNIAKA